MSEENMFEGLSREKRLIALSAFLIEDANLLPHPVALLGCMCDLSPDLRERLLSLANAVLCPGRFRRQALGLLFEADAFRLTTSNGDNALQAKGPISVTDSCGV